MKSFSVTGLLLASLFALTQRAGAADPTTTLWFDKPATRFQQSLPLGNGRIGAMVFGGVDEERIVLNESSVWSGSREDADRPDAHQVLPEIRRLLLEGNNVEAERLVNANFTCQGQGSGHGRGANVPFGCYQTLGNLRLKFGDARSGPSLRCASGHRAWSDDQEIEFSMDGKYSRTLDLRTALAKVVYKEGGVRFTREHFISAPDEVFVSRLTADQPGALSFAVMLDRPERFETTAPADNELLMTGTLDDGRGGKGVSYAARLRVLARGGSVKSRRKHARGGESRRGRAASCRRDGLPRFRRPAIERSGGRDAKRSRPGGEEILRRTPRGTEGGSRKILQPRGAEPAGDRQQRVADRSSGWRVSRKGADDPALAALYFNFGRYLLISSSRPGGLPANLQGIWAEEIQTPWNGDWHLDINVQMNYWPAEVCNLSELHEPLHKLIASLVEPGRKTAQAYYNARGWVAHVITNPWGFTSPGENASWGATVSGSAWLCQHLWEHYAFTLDREFLRWAYPILKESSLFYLDNLIEEPKHKWLVTGPSNSPENRFTLPDGKAAHVCLGPTIDMQLLRELFGNTARAAEILDLDADLRRELTEKRARLAPNQIGPDGRLQEWLEPYPEPEPTHRHTSHMYGLHPYYEITLRGTPELAAACRKSLEVRGDKSNGWALAWRDQLLGAARRRRPRAPAAPIAAAPHGRAGPELHRPGRRHLCESVRRLPAVPDRRQFRRLRRHRRDAAPIARRRNRAAARAAQGVADRQRQGPARPRRVRGGHRLERRQARRRLAAKQDRHVRHRPLRRSCNSAHAASRGGQKHPRKMTRRNAHVISSSFNRDPTGSAGVRSGVVASPSLPVGSRLNEA